MENIYYHVGSHHHGLFIKEARMRLGYSLSEVASEICDMSYLCKIEKGTATPNKQLFTKIAKRLDICIPEMEVEWIDSSVKNFLYLGEVKEVGKNIDQVYLKAHEKQLLAFIQAVLEKDDLNARQSKEAIDKWRDHLLDREKQIYDLFTGMYFIGINHWEEAGKYLARSLQATKRLDIQDPVLDLHLAYYYFHIENLCAGFYHLDQASTLFRKKCARFWVIKCDLLWCTERIKAGVVDEVELCLKGLCNLLTAEKDSLNVSKVNSIWGMWYEFKNKHELAKYHYLKSVDLNQTKELEHCIIRTMDFFYRQNQIKELLDFLSQLTNSELSQSGQILAEYYHFKVCNDEGETFKNFLIKEAIPQGKKTMNLKRVTRHMQELTGIYRRRMQYKKEADVHQQLIMFKKKFESMKKLDI